MSRHSESFLAWRRRLLLGVPGSIWAASLVGAQDRPERSSLRLAMSGKAEVHHLSLAVAEQLGYFRAEGLDVELQEHQGSGQAEQALLQGKADVAAGGFEHPLLLRARGIDCKAFICLGRAPQTVFGVNMLTLPDYRRIGQLKGRRVGVSSIGSSTHWFATTVLARDGMTARDVEFVSLGAPVAAVDAVHEKRIDALSSIDPVITMLETRGELRVLVDTRSLRGTREALGGPMPGRSLYAWQDYIARYPRTVQALTNAVVRALKWMQTAGPSDIVRTLPESHMYGGRAVYMAALDKAREAFSPDGLAADEGALTALKAITQYGPLLTEPLPSLEYRDAYTNEFARRANQRYQGWTAPTSSKDADDPKGGKPGRPVARAEKA